MTLLHELAQHALQHHPEQATLLLERLDEAETVRLLERGSIASAAAILERLSPNYCAAVLRGTRAERAGRILDQLPVDAATRVIRRADGDLQRAVLAHVDQRMAASIRAVLRFPPECAGGLMDPEVLALPRDLSARDALARVRKESERARYNLYVVDQEQRLVGALNLRELLCARGSLLLGDLMTAEPHRVVATADRATVLAHPGWKAVHALPVVDEAGAYLGAIRYRVLRQLERELQPARGQDFDTGEALGQVFATAARGLIDAFSGEAEREPRRTSDGSQEGG